MAAYRDIPGGGSDDSVDGLGATTSASDSEGIVVNFTDEPIEGAVVPLYDHHEITNFFLLAAIVVGVAYVITVLKATHLRQNARYVLLSATVGILMLQVIVVFSTQIGYPPWVNPRILCDITYVISRAFYDVTLLLYIAILAERLNATRDFLSTLSMGLSIALVVLLLFISITWEGLVQHVIVHGTTSLADGTCYLDVTVAPLNVIYPVQDSLVLFTLGGLSIAAYVVHYRLGVDADDVMLPAVTGLMVTLMKAPYVIMIAGLKYWSPPKDVVYTLYMIELGPCLLVPLIWLLGDHRTRASCCSGCPCAAKEAEAEKEPLNRYVH